MRLKFNQGAALVVVCFAIALNAQSQFSSEDRNPIDLLWEKVESISPTLYHTNAEPYELDEILKQLPDLSQLLSILENDPLTHDGLSQLLAVRAHLYLSYLTLAQAEPNEKIRKQLESLAHHQKLLLLKRPELKLSTQHQSLKWGSFLEKTLRELSH